MTDPEPGLSDLSDDQLVELLNEVCMEAATRDPIVRTLAQGCIRGVGALLPEIRRKVRKLVEEVNAKELGEQDDDDDYWAGASTFSWPPNSNQPAAPIKTIRIRLPAGSFFDSKDLASILEKHLGMRVPIRPSLEACVFDVKMTYAQFQIIHAHPSFASFHMVIV